MFISTFVDFYITQNHRKSYKIKKLGVSVAIVLARALITIASNRASIVEGVLGIILSLTKKDKPEL